MSYRRRLLAPTLSILATACATAGTPSYATLANEYRAAGLQLRAATADDARVFEAEHLDRTALIRAVLARNPSGESARQAWRAALARYRSAGAYDDPMVMASFAPLSVGVDHAAFGYEVEISQAIPLGGKLSAQRALAAAETQVVQNDFREVRLKLANAASDLYDDYDLAVRSLEIQAQHVIHLTAIKQNAVSAYESGHSSALDSLQADAEIARVEYQITIYETRRDVTIAQINALLHRAPGEHLPPPARRPPRDTSEPTAAPQPPPPNAAPALALERRPDIAAARARVCVARARVDAADSEFYPDLTLSASYNSMWDMPEHRLMAGVSLNVPLQRGRRASGSDAAAAMRSMSESELQSLSDAAQSEVAVAQREVAGAERVVLLYEGRLVPIARDRIEAARAGFIASQVNFMAVIEAEHGLRSAQLELEMARADLRKRQTALERAFGRIPGLSPDEVQP